MTKDELLQKVIEYAKENGTEMTEELLFSKTRIEHIVKYRHIFVAGCNYLCGFEFSEIAEITGLRYWNVRYIILETCDEMSYKRQEYDKFKVFLEKEKLKEIDLENSDYVTILIKKSLLKNPKNMTINDNSLFNSLINNIK